MAVYTVITDAMIDQLLAGYDIGQRRQLTGITQGVENTNYRLETTKGDYILTIYERRVTPAELPFFIGLKGHLAAKHFPCPSPVADKTGQILQTIKDKPMAIVTFLQGASITIPNEQHCRKAGEVLATLHLQAADFTIKRPNALSQHAWRPLFADTGKATDQLETGLTLTVDHWLSRIEAEWPKDLPSGVIHADLFPDNILFSGDEISGVIDFYFACQDWFAYDLAIMINAWCFDNQKAFQREHAAALFAGYTSLRPLNQAEYVSLPVLARGAAMRFFLTRLYDWINTPADAQVQPHNPVDYLDRLRFFDAITTTEQMVMSP